MSILLCIVTFRQKIIFFLTNVIQRLYNIHKDFFFYFFIFYLFFAQILEMRFFFNQYSFSLLIYILSLFFFFIFIFYFFFYKKRSRVLVENISKNLAFRPSLFYNMKKFTAGEKDILCFRHSSSLCISFYFSHKNFIPF